MFEINDEPKFEFEIEIHEEQSIRDDGYNKIVEINGINCSGFYEIDVQKFVMAIEEMDFSNILKMWVDQCTETGFISNINYDGVKENSQPMIFTMTIRYEDFEGNNV